ncbi:MAG: hypothetical protein KF776_15705 [Burkholderiales bacterium]|nr:hypothetical protein [Burkholderiales bacterium]
MQRFLRRAHGRALAVLAAAGACIAFAQAPATVHYQGFLTTATGHAVDGTASLQVRLYAASTGGSALWAETHGSVPVANGVFAVTLGSLVPLDTSLLEGPRWVSVSVNGDPEMPRQPLASVPYAFVAKRAEALSSAAVVAGSQIQSGSITDVHVSGSAAIAASKVAMAGAFLTGQVRSLTTSGGSEFGLVTGSSVATSTESDVLTLSPATGCTASHLAVRLSAAPGGGNARAFTLRTDLFSTPLTCTVSDSATSCTSGASSVAVPPASLLALEVQSIGAPAAADAWFGWICK